MRPETSARQKATFPKDDFKGLALNQRIGFTAMGPARLAVDTTRQEG